MSDVGIVLGDFVLTSTGRFVVGIRADGTSNILDVRGSATLNDNDLVIRSLSPIDDFTGTQNFVFLTAVNGVTGQFGSFNASDFPFLDLSLIHNPNDVTLRAVRAMSPPPPPPVVTFASVAETPNQRAVAAVFDAEEMSATGDLDSVIDALVFTTTPQALNAFDSASGEIHASLLTSALTSARGFQRTNRVFAPSEDGTSIWGVAIGEWQRHNGDEIDNTRTVDNDANGFSAGISKHKGNKYIGAGVQTISLDSTRQFIQSRPVDANLTHLAAVAGLTSGKVELDASLGYGWYDFDVERNIFIGSTISRTAISSYDGSGVTAGAEARLDSGQFCLLYTSPSPRDQRGSRMPSSA